VHDRHAQLVERVAGPEQHLRLHHGRFARALGRERDPARELVALGRGERERLGVGVQHEHAGGHLHPAADGDVEQGHIPGADAGQGAREAVPPGPELREVRLPDRDRVLRGDLGADVDRVGLLPQLAEPLNRAGEPLAGHVGAADALARPDLQPVDLGRPVAGVARHGVLGSGLLGHGALLTLTVLFN
jgi:hypothetical protein